MFLRLNLGTIRLVSPISISKTASINLSFHRTGTLAWNRLKGFFCLLQRYYEKQKQPQKMFYKKAVLKDYTIITGKHLCWSLFLIKFIKNFIKKRLQHVFSCENCEIFKNLYCEEHLQTLASGKILHSNELS